MLKYSHPTDLEQIPPQRPFCPECQMRMMTVTGPRHYRALECLRCGHTEPDKPTPKA